MRNLGLALKRLFPLVELVLEAGPLLVLVLLLAVDRGSTTLSATLTSCTAAVGAALLAATIVTARIFAVAIAAAVTFIFPKVQFLLRHAFVPIFRLLCITILFCRLCHIFALLLGLGLWFWSTLFGLFLLLRFLPGGPFFLLLFLLLLLFLFRGGGRFILFLVFIIQEFRVFGI